MMSRIQRLTAALVLCVPASTALAQRTSPARICLAPTTVESAPESADNAAAAVRGSFVRFLTGPSISATPLEARLQSQVREEAKAGSCPYLLVTSVKHVRKTSGGILGRAVYGAVHYGTSEIGPIGNSAATRVATAAATGAAREAAFDYAYVTRSNDEMTLTWHLESADGQLLHEQSDKRKAKSDGEDLVTPLVQKAAESITTIVTHPGH